MLTHNLINLNDIQLLIIFFKQTLFEGNGCKTFIFIIWFLQMLPPIIQIIYESLFKNLSFMDIVCSILVNFVEHPILWGSSFFTWIISFCISSYLISLRKMLKEDKRSETLAVIRKSFIETRGIIHELDNSMSVVRMNLLNIMIISCNLCLFDYFY